MPSTLCSTVFPFLAWSNQPRMLLSARCCFAQPCVRLIMVSYVRGVF